MLVRYFLQTTNYIDQDVTKWALLCNCNEFKFLFVQLFKSLLKQLIFLSMHKKISLSEGKSELNIYIIENTVLYNGMFATLLLTAV